MRRLLLILSVLCVGILGQTVAAVEYGGLGGRPANPDPENPRTQSIFVYTLESGASKQDAVKVINNTDETKIIQLYATDSEVASGGSFACMQKVDAKKGVGRWIRFDKDEVTLAAKTEETVGFSISIPNKISVGEHNGCVVIQEKGGASKEGENGVQLSFRSALRVAVTVPGDIRKDLDFGKMIVREEAKKYVITTSLLNKGNVSLDTDVKVFVKNFFNKTIYENGGTYPVLAQEQPVELNFEFSRPYWGGIYRVVGSAQYNDDPNAPLGSGAEKKAIKKAPTKVLFVAPHPSALGVILLGAAAVVLGVWMVYRRYVIGKKLAKAWKPYKVRSGDNIMSLAKARGVHWKTVARVNKLRAPYEIGKGSTIKLPGKPKKTKE